MLAGQASHPHAICAPTVGWTACIAGVSGDSISGRANQSGVFGDKSGEQLLGCARQKQVGLEGGSLSCKGWKQREQPASNQYLLSQKYSRFYGHLPRPGFRLSLVLDRSSSILALFRCREYRKRLKIRAERRRPSATHPTTTPAIKRSLQTGDIIGFCLANRNKNIYVCILN